MSYLMESIVILSILLIGAIFALWITYQFILTAMRLRKNKDTMNSGQIVVEQREWSQAQLLGQRLEEKIHSMELILDNEVPDWRKQ